MCWEETLPTSKAIGEVYGHAGDRKNKGKKEQKLRDWERTLNAEALVLSDWEDTREERGHGEFVQRVRDTQYYRPSLVNLSYCPSN